MENYYIVFVVALLLLAAFDLVVGVSNDAVNFLNSAIGSKVARRRTIMFVASGGILVGSIFSNGMMEVARKGIFHPDHFMFEEIMLLFVAVMITDVILLDVFNSLGLPTSTTVSIVFELLGAAVMISLIKLTQADQGLAHIVDYINHQKALQIIGGILLSVVVSFSVGALVMYISRLIYSFNYEKRMKWAGGIWGGIALTAITYFLLIKGLKSTNLVDKETLTWVKENTWLIVAILFAAWTVIMQFAFSVLKLNILRFIVLTGTFALAMAFAGNDLVNFIGVPIAGIHSYEAWSASGVPGDAFSMDVLSEKVAVENYMLIIAGLIMVATLWFSRKARTVTDTELSLAKQNEASEKFKPGFVSRMIVRATGFLGKIFKAIVPASVRASIDRNFQPVDLKAGKEGKPAFDLIRASVNLAVAAILISYATSKKLPLSTTYVTFMVAMGTSLADRAWGRDSAVYRISGVLTVIGGWFMTALSAFTAAAVAALILMSFGMGGFVFLVLLAAGLIVRSHFAHRAKERAMAEQEAMEAEDEQLPEQVVTAIREEVEELLLLSRKAYTKSIQGLASEDEADLKSLQRRVKRLNKRNKMLRDSVYHSIKRVPDEEGVHTEWYINILHAEADVVQTTLNVVDYCLEHVSNVHNPLSHSQAESLTTLASDMQQFLEELIAALKADDRAQVEKAFEKKAKIGKRIRRRIRAQVKGIKSGNFGRRNSLLYLSLLMETQDLLNHSRSLTELFDDQRNSESLDEESEA